ncbi:collagen alpha-5(VI) chain-like [Mercenaria mercenaria]|uniref:collagen alpha-5(VI) chain-like n=1 Tax=Mercenaria mercenaria TaxID=6596 RepID=UPI00234EA9E1|nr:collagen alpha-5(VI) chain-like [Mercenaria mercenaria]
MLHVMLHVILCCVFINVLTVNGGGPHFCSPGYANPCQNGATCLAINGGYSYSCRCKAGFTGKNCDLIDCSSSIYCKNGGTCSATNGGTSYNCNCADGWKGKNCEYIDCSSPIHCGSYGICQPINGGYDKTCICLYGWTGPNCAKIDICTPYKEADIVFVMDNSLSGGNGTMGKQKEYVKNFMSKYRTGPPNNRYQFSLVTYSLQATVHFYLNTYNNDTDLQNAVDLVDDNCGGPSFTGSALSKVRQDVFMSVNGARDNTVVERYVILLTDGLSSDPADAIQEANILKSEGVKIYTVCSGMSIRHEELLEISSFKDHVFPMATEGALQTLLKYTMFGCENCSKNVSDVAVLMDVSANIKPKEFDTQLKAVIHLLGITDVGLNATQFSYSTFTDTMHNIYSFDTHGERVDLIAEVSKKTKHVFSTNGDVANALSDLYQNGLSSSKRSRSEARQIVVLITSGHVDDTNQVRAEAQRLKDSGNIIITIGAGLSANMTNLLEISSDPAFTYILGDDVNINVDVLDSLKTTFVYDFCSNI